VTNQNICEFMKTADINRVKCDMVRDYKHG